MSHIVFTDANSHVCPVPVTELMNTLQANEQQLFGMPLAILTNIGANMKQMGLEPDQEGAQQLFDWAVAGRQAQNPEPDAPDAKESKKK